MTQLSPGYAKRLRAMRAHLDEVERHLLLGESSSAYMALARAGIELKVLSRWVNERLTRGQQ